MFTIEEKVKMEHLQETVIELLKEGSLIYKNIEITLDFFDQNQNKIDHIGAFILGGRDKVLEYVKENKMEAILVPFEFYGVHYYVTFKVVLK